MSRGLSLFLETLSLYCVRMRLPWHYNLILFAPYKVSPFCRRVVNVGFLFIFSTHAVVLSLLKSADLGLVGCPSNRIRASPNAQIEYFLPPTRCPNQQSHRLGNPHNLRHSRALSRRHRIRHLTLLWSNPGNRSSPRLDPIIGLHFHRIPSSNLDIGRD